MTTFRIRKLESLGFEWDGLGAAWEDRLGELADYRKIQGHCNVPSRYKENTKLGKWVSTQRENYKLQQKGKKSHMTTFRIRKLESLGFEWDGLGAAWEDRLGELADYRKIQGHCNVPSRYKENTKLGKWVRTQRTQCRLRLEGNKSNLTAL
jgi:predicted chitinase